MRKIAAALLTTLIALSAAAHQGHIHNYLGTVKAADQHHLVITTEAGKQAEFVLDESTRYTRDGKSASSKDLVRGLRVSVYVGEEGMTAKSITLAGN